MVNHPLKHQDSKPKKVAVKQENPAPKKQAAVQLGQKDIESEDH